MQMNALVTYTGLSEIIMIAKYHKTITRAEICSLSVDRGSSCTFSGFVSSYNDYWCSSLAVTETNTMLINSRDITQHTSYIRFSY
jgi:hypothetical protein